VITWDVARKRTNRAACYNLEISPVATST
jgi:hypothetical protein